MYGKIQTILGVIDSSELGFCQCHEHLFIKDGPPARSNPDLRIDDLDKTAAELIAYRSSGGKSLIDAWPPGCRMESHLLEASQRSGVQIIASTGFHRSVYYPENDRIHRMDESRPLNPIEFHDEAVDQQPRYPLPEACRSWGEWCECSWSGRLSYGRCPIASLRN